MIGQSSSLYNTEEISCEKIYGLPPNFQLRAQNHSPSVNLKIVKHRELLAGLVEHNIDRLTFLCG